MYTSTTHHTIGVYLSCSLIKIYYFVLLSGGFHTVFYCNKWKNKGSCVFSRPLSYLLHGKCCLVNQTPKETGYIPLYSPAGILNLPEPLLWARTVFANLSIPTHSNTEIQIRTKCFKGKITCGCVFYKLLPFDGFFIIFFKKAAYY